MTKEVELVEPQRWRFTSIEAAEAAHEVVHHTPDTPWDRVPMPANAEAAASSVRALADEFDQLPPSIRGALGRATRNAAQLSDDRLQGLAELLQNADDVGADEAFFFVDDDRLLFGHNGSDLTLPDVWGLTIPRLSEKSDQADAVGRFGIGLKTLGNRQMQAGMPAEVIIKTGERTVLEYILHPLLKRIAATMKEE